MRNALNKLADTVENPEDKRVSFNFYSHIPPAYVSAGRRGISSFNLCNREHG